MRLLARYLIVLLCLVSVSIQAQADSSSCTKLRQFTFSWPFADSCGMEPRGGTTKGAEVQLQIEPTRDWKSLQQPSLTAFQRDRLAILAMAGIYRTSFDFLETIGYVPGFEPSRPYQSWGTELVLVAEDRGDFISLQHLMVMYFQDESGKTSGPIVMKHWRQDWAYQPKEYMAYDGESHWSMHPVNREDAAGSWAQTVYQVDDSPRYGGVGRWDHKTNFSTWLSNETWRPLPRREYSVRDDYQVLIGTNRHSILPNGWVHEQENYKVRLGEHGRLSKETPYLAKELGVNRYERIVNFDFSAGHDYWNATAPFWLDVVSFWKRKLVVNGEVSFKTRNEGTLMFQPLFEFADELFSDERIYDAEEGRKFIQETLDNYLTE